MTNFTQVDVFGTLRAVPFFALVFLGPGYCVGRACNVLGFRTRHAAEQWLLSMGISMVVVPISLNVVSRWLSIHLALAASWALIAIACVDLLLRWRRAGFPLRIRIQRSTAIALGLAALWAMVCLVSLPDMQIGRRLYSTALVEDLGVRSAFAASAMHGGAPPANPFFYPGALVKLRYYYYWYVVTAIPGGASGVEPRAAFFASSIWSGWLLAAAVALFMKYFYGVRRRLRVACVVGMALLGVTGLDALCVLALYLRNHVVLFDTESWDSEQVTSWVGSLLWVPHHVAATSACMIAFVFLWQAQSARQRLVLGVLAALGFASAAGLSVYVTFAFALFLVSAALYWLARRRFRVVVLYAAVGVLVVLFSGGYLRDLRATEANVVLSAPAQAQPPAHFAKVALRHIPATLVLVLERAVHGNKMATRLLRPFALVLVVFLEFGFFFLAAVRQALSDWRERCLVADVDPAVRELRDIRWLSWLMLGAGLWVALMMRSTVINNNDLAFRGVEVAQFILLIWGAAQLAGAHPETELAAESLQSPMTASAFPSVIRPRVGWLAGCLLLLGLVSTAYQLSILRLYLWGSDRYGWSTLPQSELKNRVGEITQELRAAYAALDRSLPASAKVQFGAAPKLYLQHLFYSRYQHVEGMFPDCGTSFGGSEAVCARLVEQVGPIFGTSALPPTATNSQWQVLSVPTLKTSEQVRALCNDLGIDAIVITGEDPVWNDANAWPSTMKPLYAADFVAAYICR